MTSLTWTTVLALAVACLTAGATAVRSASRIWLRHWAERRLAGAEDGMALVVERPKRLLMAAGTGIAALVFALGAMLGMREQQGAMVSHLAWGALTLLVVGQLVPRAAARRWAPQLLPVFLPILNVLEVVCRPVFAIAGAVAGRVAEPLGSESEEAREHLDELLREGEMEGVGEASESAIITGVVAFGLLKARDVMTPRSEIVAVDRALPAEGVIRLMAQSKYSRVPVYVGDLDHCVGLVHSFDVLAHPDTPLDAPRRLSQWSADTPAQEILRRMLRERVHLAIIQDATGATVGLVTLEDLVEELVGDISDEHDEPQGQLS